MWPKTPTGGAWRTVGVTGGASGRVSRPMAIEATSTWGTPLHPVMPPQMPLGTGTSKRKPSGSVAVARFTNVVSRRVPLGVSNTTHPTGGQADVPGATIDDAGNHQVSAGEVRWPGQQELGEGTSDGRALPTKRRLDGCGPVGRTNLVDAEQALAAVAIFLAAFAGDIDGTLKTAKRHQEDEPRMFQQRSIHRLHHQPPHPRVSRPVDTGSFATAQRLGLRQRCWPGVAPTTPGDSRADLRIRIRRGRLRVTLQQSHVGLFCFGLPTKGPSGRAPAGRKPPASLVWIGSGPGPRVEARSRPLGTAGRRISSSPRSARDCFPRVPPPAGARAPDSYRQGDHLTACNHAPKPL